MVFLKRLAILIVPLVVTSCWSPWFNADLSLAELTKAKLTEDGVFSVYMGYDRTLGDALAVPERVRFPNYVTTVFRGWDRYATATFSKVSGAWLSSYYPHSRSFDMALTHPTLLQAFGGMPKSSPLNWEVAVFEPTLGTGSIEVLSDTSGTPYPSIAGEPVLGVYASPDPTVTGNAVLYVLELKPGTSELTLSPWNSTTLGPVWTDSGTTIWGVPGYSGPQSYGWLAVDPSELSYKVIYWTHHEAVNGRYLTEKFDPGVGTAVKTWNRTDRVEAFLTTKKLLTRDGSFYLVCDADGNVEYSFAAGTLQFAGEFWDTTENRYRLRFTEAVSLGSDTGSGDFRIGLFSVPTTELASLR